MEDKHNSRFYVQFQFSSRVRVSIRARGVLKDVFLVHNRRQP